MLFVKGGELDSTELCWIIERMPGRGSLVKNAATYNCQLQLRIRCLIKAAVPPHGAPAWGEGVIHRSWTLESVLGSEVETYQGYLSKHLPAGVRPGNLKTG